MTEASPNAEAIARELAALGEDSPSEAELALVGPAVHDDPEVATVERLAELAEPFAFEPLSELEGHRAWRQIEQRIEADGSSKPDQAGGGPSPTRWLYALVGLAAAAALALIVIPREPKTETASQDQSAITTKEVTKQGDTVRAALAVIDDGRSDTARAEARVAAYRQQLEEQDG